MRLMKLSDAIKLLLTKGTGHIAMDGTHMDNPVIYSEPTIIYRTGNVYEETSESLVLMSGYGDDEYYDDLIKIRTDWLVWSKMVTKKELYDMVYQISRSNYEIKAELVAGIVSKHLLSQLSQIICMRVNPPVDEEDDDDFDLPEKVKGQGEFDVSI